MSKKSIAEQLEELRVKLDIPEAEFREMSMLDVARRLVVLEGGSSCVTADGRPDFAGFAAALRSEVKWLAEIHRRDNTGQSASDQRTLGRLAEQVEFAGNRLGYIIVKSPGRKKGLET